MCNKSYLYFCRHLMLSKLVGYNCVDLPVEQLTKTTELVNLNIDVYNDRKQQKTRVYMLNNNLHCSR